MKYLGIDYGTKKIGIARSDESGTMAFPVSVIPNDARHKTLFALIAKEQPDVIVIGESKNLDGAHNAITETITALVTDITLEFGVPVHTAPEHFTSVEAKRNTKKELADASAAALILQGFIDIRVKKN